MDKDVLALLQRYDETYNPPQTLSNSGIYILYFIESKKFYIGSCKDYKARVLRHKRELLKGTNNCGVLQEHFTCNKLFISELIESIDLPWERSKFFNREEFWLKKLRADEDGLNISCFASGGDTISTNPRRAEIKASISAGLKHGISLLSEAEYSERFNIGIKRVVSNPEEFSAKMSALKAGSNHHFYDKNLSEAHKAKLKLSCTGSKQPHAVKCEINGVVYDTLTAAEKDLGVGRKLIKYRCNSPTNRFSSWKLIA